MFNGSITLVTLFGVPVRVHWTFLILLAWVFGTGLYRGGSPAQGAASVAFVVAIFACVVAHEFGHILAARSFGVRTRSVTLLPIGGVAALERMPDKPWQELLVALAGPLVNVVIALALLPGALWPAGIDTLTTFAHHGESLRGFVIAVAGVNAWLVVFNMIPAFPMDGGRVLRALLAMATNRVSATRIAALVGQGIAVVMAFVGVFAGMPMLLILAIFVFLGAGAEAAGTASQELLRGLPVADVMVRSFRVLGETESLAAAVDELLANSQTDFPVTRDGTVRTPVVGLLTRADLIRGLSQRGPASMVRDAMREPCPPVSPGDTASSALRRLRDTSCTLIPVVEDGTVVGLLTAENVSEAIMVRDALSRNRPAGGG